MTAKPKTKTCRKCLGTYTGRCGCAEGPLRWDSDTAGPRLQSLHHEFLNAGRTDRDWLRPGEITANHQVSEGSRLHGLMAGDGEQNYFVENAEPQIFPERTARKYKLPSPKDARPDRCVDLARKSREGHAGSRTELIAITYSALPAGMFVPRAGANANYNDQLKNKNRWYWAVEYVLGVLDSNAPTENFGGILIAAKRDFLDDVRNYTRFRNRGFAEWGSKKNARKLSRDVARKHRGLNGRELLRLKDLKLRPESGEIVSFYLRALSREGPGFVAPTHSLVAAMLGSSPQAVGKTIRRLKKLAGKEERKAKSTERFRIEQEAQVRKTQKNPARLKVWQAERKAELAREQLDIDIWNACKVTKIVKEP
jgi:hypothetical protein